MNDDHPSSFQLDLLALGHPSAEVERHARGCARCQEQLLASRPTEGPVPGWVPSRVARTFPTRLALAAVAVAAVGIGLGTAGRNGDGTRAKGFPAISIHVEHGGTARLWDGRSPVSPGDRLQLTVAGAGYRHVLVGVEEGGTWSALHAGPISPSAPTTLPVSFQVDADGGPFLLGLLLCDGPCQASELPGASSAARRDAQRWWTAFRFSTRRGQ